jgi:hypothetical protein
MKIRFHSEVDREAKTIETLVECAQCGQEVQLKNEAGQVTFLCPTHGELGRKPFEEFQQALLNSERFVAEAEGLSQPARRSEHFIPTDPDKMN